MPTKRRLDWHRASPPSKHARSIAKEATETSGILLRIYHNKEICGEAFKKGYLEDRVSQDGRLGASAIPAVVPESPHPLDYVG